MKKSLFLIAATIALTACKEEIKVYTVDEFKADDKLRAEFVAKCKNGELHPQDLNCINSNKADTKVRYDKMRQELRKQYQ